MRFRPQELNGLDPQGGSPFGFDGVGMRLYLVQADMAPLREICQEFLTSVAQQFGQTYSWTPITTFGQGLVMISVVTYDKMYSAPHPELGFTSQEEIIFSIPVVKRNSLGIPVGVAFFAPYCFVTDDWSIITGRCVLGYPKSEGWFELPGVDPNQCPPYPSPGSTPEFPIRVSARALRKLTHDEAAEPELVFHVPQQPEPDYPSIPLDDKVKAWPFGPVDGLYGREGLLPIEEEEVVKLLESLAGIGAPQLTLKQFRDADVTSDACYQALVDFDILFKKFHGAGLLRLAEMRLHDYPSLNIAKRLGLAGNPVAGESDVYSFKPVFAYWYSGDFTLEDDAAAVLGGCGAEIVTPPPLRGCDAMVRQATDAIGDLTTGQLEQWRKAGESVLQGKYGFAEYRRDLTAAFEQSVGCGRELADLYWQSLADLTKWSWGGASGDAQK